MVPIYRYEPRYNMVTPRDPLHELLIQLEYLKSKEFVIDTLTAVHAVSAADARTRVGVILAHTRLACSYIDLALASRDEMGFLPAYYALLNLLKLHILFSPRHADLPANRWHGASYGVYTKDSHNILTEEIVLRSAGAIPLFYEAVTGSRYADRTRVQMRDIYPYIRGVAVEWEFAGREPQPRLAVLSAEMLQREGQRVPKLMVHYRDWPATMQRRYLRVLTADYRRHRDSVGAYLARRPLRAGVTEANAVRAGLRTYLLYSDSDGKPYTPVSARSLLLPEEIPIALAFFHLSSVVRYKPEFLSKLRDSRYWPVLAALRYHGLYRATLLFCSHVQQRTLFINPRPDPEPTSRAGLTRA